MRAFLLIACALLAAATAQAQTLDIDDWIRGSEGRRGFNRPMTLSDTAGVYLLNTAYTQILIEWTRVAPFDGGLYVCDVADADSNDDGTLDAAAGCSLILDMGSSASGVSVTTAKPYLVLDIDVAAPGWHAPPTASALEASLQQASRSFFGAPAVAMGCGGSIPFMESLSRSMPEAQFVVTGVLGPRSNAHGPNEFLHLPTAKKLTAAMTMVVHQWAANEVTAVHNPVGPERQPESAS